MKIGRSEELRDAKFLLRPPINTTRREALINFLISLQSPEDGGFRWRLGGHEGSATCSYEVLTSLYYLNATDRINEKFFMYFVEKTWVEWTYNNKPMGGFTGFVVEDWNFEKSFIAIYDTASILSCLYYIGKLDEFIDQDKKERIINFILSLYDEETGEFYEGYFEGYLNEIKTPQNAWSAVLTLYLLNALDRIDADTVARGIMRYYVCYNDTYGVFEDEFSWQWATMKSIRVLALLGKLDLVPRDKILNTMEFVYDNSTGGTVDNNLGTMLMLLSVLYNFNALDIIKRNKTVSWILSFQNPFKYGGFAFPGKEENSATCWCAVESLYYLNALGALDQPFQISYAPPGPPKGPPPESSDQNDSSETEDNEPSSNEETPTPSPPNPEDPYGFVFGLIAIVGFALLIIGIIKIIEANWRRLRRLVKKLSV